MRLRSLTDAITLEPYYLEPVTGLQIRRTSGAIVWPAPKGWPGSVIVLGETRSKPNFLVQRRHDVYRLAEYASVDVTALLETVQRWTLDYYVRNWATPQSDQRVYLIDDANDEQFKLRRPRINYSDPIGWVGKGEGLVPFYNALVQRRTTGEKTLHLGHDCMAVEQMLHFGGDADDVVSRNRPTEYPAAAALWFALAEIDLDPRAEYDGPDDREYGPADSIGGY